MKVMKRATCPGLSGKTTLTYELGVEGERSLSIRLLGSSGGGYHWTDPVPMAALVEQLKAANQPFTSYALHGPFAGRSVNTSAFLAAVLRAEKIIQPDKTNRLAFVCDDLDAAEAKLLTRLKRDNDTKAGPKKASTRKVAASAL